MRTESPGHPKQQARSGTGGFPSRLPRVRASLSLDRPAGGVALAPDGPRDRDGDRGPGLPGLPGLPGSRRPVGGGRGGRTALAVAEAADAEPLLASHGGPEVAADALAVDGAGDPALDGDVLAVVRLPLAVDGDDGALTRRGRRPGRSGPVAAAVVARATEPAHLRVLPLQFPGRG